jgi:sulfide:quinone oxidoreductase
LPASRALSCSARSSATAAGEELPYDYLVLATGADMRAEEVPGLAENAETI